MKIGEHMVSKKLLPIYCYAITSPSQIFENSLKVFHQRDGPNADNDGADYLTLNDISDKLDSPYK